MSALGTRSGAESSAGAGDFDALQPIYDESPKVTAPTDQQTVSAEAMNGDSPTDAWDVVDELAAPPADSTSRTSATDEWDTEEVRGAAPISGASAAAAPGFAKQRTASVPPAPGNASATVVYRTAAEPENGEASVADAAPADRSTAEAATEPDAPVTVKTKRHRRTPGLKRRLLKPRKTAAAAPSADAATLVPGPVSARVAIDVYEGIWAGGEDAAPVWAGAPGSARVDDTAGDDDDDDDDEALASRAREASAVAPVAAAREPRAAEDLPVPTGPAKDLPALTDPTEDMPAPTGPAKTVAPAPAKPGPKPPTTSHPTTAGETKAQPGKAPRPAKGRPTASRPTRPAAARPAAARPATAGPAAVVHSTDPARTRLGILAVGVGLVTAAVVVPSVLAGTARTPPAPVVAAPSAAPLDQAEAWLTGNVDRDEQLVVDESLRSDLIGAGWPSDDILGYTTGQPLPAGWQNADYVVTAAGSASAVAHDTVVVASFGAGADAAEIRAVVPEGAAAAEAAEADAAAARLRDGAQLAENPSLTLTDADRELLATGGVDDRIVIILGALTGTGSVVVDGFPAIDGEGNGARRQVALTTLGERALARDGQLTNDGIAVVQGLIDSYMPAAASVDGDRLILRYPITIGEN